MVSKKSALATFKANTLAASIAVSDEMDAPKYGVMRQTEIATNQLIRSVRYAV